MNNKYEQGKIYKIVSDNTDQIYIGSTVISLNRRFGKHLSDYRRWIFDKGNYVASYDIISEGDARIELIELFPCNTKDELRQREQFYLDANKDICVNYMNSFGHNKEKRNASNTKHRQSEKRKAWIQNYNQSETHKAHIKKNNRSESHKIANKKYKQSQKGQEKKYCEYCDLFYTPSNFAQHKRSIVHQDNEKYFNDL